MCSGAKAPFPPSRKMPDRQRQAALWVLVGSHAHQSSTRTDPILELRRGRKQQLQPEGATRKMENQKCPEKIQLGNLKLSILISYWEVLLLTPTHYVVVCFCTADIGILETG